MVIIDGQMSGTYVPPLHADAEEAALAHLDIFGLDSSSRLQLPPRLLSCHPLKLSASYVAVLLSCQPLKL